MCVICINLKFVLTPIWGCLAWCRHIAFPNATPSPYYVNVRAWLLLRDVRTSANQLSVGPWPGQWPYDWRPLRNCSQAEFIIWDPYLNSRCSQRLELRISSHIRLYSIYDFVMRSTNREVPAKTQTPLLSFFGLLEQDSELGVEQDYLIGTEQDYKLGHVWNKSATRV